MISPASVPATIRIRLFASYAERLGSELIEVPAEGIATVADLLERLRALPNGTVIGDATAGNAGWQWNPVLGTQPTPVQLTELADVTNQINPLPNTAGVEVVDIL